MDYLNYRCGGSAGFVSLILTSFPFNPEFKKFREPEKYVAQLYVVPVVKSIVVYQVQKLLRDVEFIAVIFKFKKGVFKCL